MLAAAYELFCAQGYPATTMAAIAARARVAVQTLHFTFHTKAELLAEVIRVQSAGQEDPAPVMDRSWIEEGFKAADPRRLLALVVEHGTDIYVRMAPLVPAIQSAASSDPEIAQLWTDVSAGRRAGMRRFVEAVAEKGRLAPNLTIDRATDLLFVLQSHEVFLGLTRDSGWTVPEYKAWQLENLCLQLMGDRAPQIRRAAGGLSYEHLLPTRSQGHQAGLSGRTGRRSGSSTTGTQRP